MLSRLVVPPRGTACSGAGFGIAPAGGLFGSYQLVVGFPVVGSADSYGWKVGRGGIWRSNNFSETALRAGHRDAMSPAPLKSSLWIASCIWLVASWRPEE